VDLRSPLSLAACAALISAPGCRNGGDDASSAPTPSVPSPKSLSERPRPSADSGSSMGFPLESEYGVVPALGGRRFDRPVQLTHAPGDLDHVYIVEQRGRILRVPLDDRSAEPTVFLDRSVRRAHNEEGLLGLAFPPDYATSGVFYVDYSASKPRQSKLSRYRTVADRSKAEPASEEVLLTVKQPFGNHNGGGLAFGPDGKLYLSLGDGGAAGDPHHNGQDLSSLLGKILRFDAPASGPLKAPDDNPFVGRKQAKPEIWAYGLRNVWRFSFDRDTGDLWAGDVGQDTIEEIDVVKKGGNYGWNEAEGDQAFRRGSPSAQMSPPVFQYERNKGFSVTGGFVYRGQDVPALEGAYVYGDYGTGTIWALRRDESGAVVSNEDLAIIPEVASFGEDARGELYAVSLRGDIHRFVSGTADRDDFPQTLSQTELFDDVAALKPNAALRPYTPNVTFWSDGATKKRWLVLPEGASIDASEPTWAFPVGTLTVKHFELPGDEPRRLETRVMVHEQGGWAGYSYRWNDAQTDATLVTTSGTQTVSVDREGQPHEQRWYFPAGADCLRCHTEGYGRVLGVRSSQLGGTSTLAAWKDAKLFAGAVAKVEPLPALDDASVPVQERARAYLDVNCAVCHNEAGTARWDQNFSWGVSQAKMHVVGVDARNALGLPGEQRIAPGKPGSSSVLVRMQRLDSERMPPLASNVVDAEAVALLQSWVEQL